MNNTPDYNEQRFDTYGSTSEYLRLLATGEVHADELIPMSLEEYRADVQHVPHPSTEDMHQSIRYLLDDDFNRFSVSGHFILPLLLVDVVEREQLGGALNGEVAPRKPYPYLHYFVLDESGWTALGQDTQVRLIQALPPELLNNKVLISWGSAEQERSENMSLKPEGIEQALHQSIGKLLTLLNPS